MKGNVGNTLASFVSKVVVPVLLFVLALVIIFGIYVTVRDYQIILGLSSIHGNL